MAQQMPQQQQQQPQQYQYGQAYQPEQHHEQIHQQATIPAPAYHSPPPEKGGFTHPPADAHVAPQQQHEAYHAPQEHAVQRAHSAPQDWQNGFWDCFSPGSTCCMTYWCPCVVFGRTRERLKDPSMVAYSPVNANCVGFCALAYCGFSWVFQMVKRSEMRDQLNLDGSGIGDCARPYCCPCCTIIQEEKESAARLTTHAAGGYQAPNASMQYA